MQRLFRLLTILAGYFAAVTVGLIVPAAAIFIGFPDRNSLSFSAIAAAISGAVSLILLVGGLLLLPALFVIAICEAFRIRNMFANLMLGALVAVALAIYTVGFESLSNTNDLFNLAISIVTGLVAGFIYWSIAGRTAGEW